MATVIDDHNLIATSHLPMRLAKTLISRGFTYVSDFSEMTDAEILSLEGVGELSLRQIRSALQELKCTRKTPNDELL